VRSIALHPSELSLATLDGEGTVRLWDMLSGQLLLSWTERGVKLTDLAFTTDGRKLAAILIDEGRNIRSVLVWDASPTHEPDGDSFVNGIGMKLKRIPAGRFLMGSSTNEPGRGIDEEQHPVEITSPFHMGVVEVTQEEFYRLMGYNPSSFSEEGKRKAAVKGLDTSRLPVEGVSWEVATEFCNRLSNLPEERKRGRVYRLPTEAEWEYACRAGSNLSGVSKPPPNLGRPASVASYQPNAFGLHDMQGCLWEWCSDYYSVFSAEAAKDPTGPLMGTERVLRGCAWSDNHRPSLRIAARLKRPPNVIMDVGGGGIVGFRVACDILYAQR
jgi:formylglycine-generating enzyme required for sulfatase activity